MNLRSQTSVIVTHSHVDGLSVVADREIQNRTLAPPPRKFSEKQKNS